MAGKADPRPIFAKRLNYSIRNSGMTARRFCELCGISESSMSKYRKGIAMPGRGRILRMSSVLHLDPMWLLGYQEDNARVSTEDNYERIKLESLIKNMTTEELKNTIEFIEKYIRKDTNNDK